MIHKSFTVQITVLKGYHLFYNDKDAIPKLNINGNHDLVMIKMCKSWGEVFKTEAGLPRKQMDQLYPFPQKQVAFP